MINSQSNSIAYKDPSMPLNQYNSIKEALDSADHASIVAPICEGDVYKSTVKVNGQTIHFKVINNKYLLKVED